MPKIEYTINEINKNICLNISKFIDDRGFLSQNILSNLRTFVEAICLYEYCCDNNIVMDYSYSQCRLGLEHVSSKSDLRFLKKFHECLQISKSHYFSDPENSERLMLKYYENLLSIKVLFKEKHGIELLENIEDFPLNLDTSFDEYYSKIAKKIDYISNKHIEEVYKNRYYIRKIKPFFVNKRIYYEVTLSLANDYSSKFDRIIAFTNKRITTNYAIRTSFVDTDINVFDKKMPVKIFTSWEVSIRPCEIKNFSKIFGQEILVNDKHAQYKGLMSHLTRTGRSLLDIVLLDKKNYDKVFQEVNEKSRINNIFNVLDMCRTIVLSKLPGSNVIRYLLYNFSNIVIRRQYYKDPIYKMANLHLHYKAIPFDEMPCCSSLIKHNPYIIELFECIDCSNREHEFLARRIMNNTEINGQIFMSEKDLEGFEDIDKLIKRYNKLLYPKHQNRRIEKFKGHLYIKEYEDNAVKIINELINLTGEGINGYKNSMQHFIDTDTTLNIDSDEKKSILLELFDSSKVSLIYGAAGTGKTTMINYICGFFNSKSKLLLANTHPAINNLKRKVKFNNNCEFHTIRSFLENNKNYNCDILIIDECSTVSNSDMAAILEKMKSKFKLLVLVGDSYQIEAITFGNWFNIVKCFLPNIAIHTLNETRRSEKPELLVLWERVRNNDEKMTESLSMNEFTHSLDQSIFEKQDEDEIVLCLNYDGLYGINNLNLFLQSSNPNESIEWGVAKYKVGDPILFNESNRFAPLIYNNLKGKILGIENYGKTIEFTIEVDEVINEMDTAEYEGLTFVSSSGDKSVISFFVEEYKGSDEDDNPKSKSNIPFQIAYAVSIHKSQGLEYNSVKVIITNEIEEFISHNIFYTAITRAREKLKIYWSVECQDRLLKKLKHEEDMKDAVLISTKNGIPFLKK